MYYQESPLEILIEIKRVSTEPHVVQLASVALRQSEACLAELRTLIKLSRECDDNKMVEHIDLAYSYLCGLAEAETDDC